MLWFVFVTLNYKSYQFSFLLNFFYAVLLSKAISTCVSQIFYTPEGMLSSEQGVYVAETVVTKNAKLAKGRYRVYEDLDDSVRSDVFHFCFKYFEKLYILNFLDHL